LPSCCDQACTLAWITTCSAPVFFTVSAALRVALERSTRIGLTSKDPA
jgi:hypothetical protein